MRITARSPKIRGRRRCDRCQNGKAWERGTEGGRKRAHTTCTFFRTFLERARGKLWERGRVLRGSRRNPLGRVCHGLTINGGGRVVIGRIIRLRGRRRRRTQGRVDGRRPEEKRSHNGGRGGELLESRSLLAELKEVFESIDPFLEVLPRRGREEKFRECCEGDQPRKKEGEMECPLDFVRRSEFNEDRKKCV
ncbi:hypothetical protein BJX64DRAFT_260559 [Aspergillus heterothallicus]